MVSFPESIFPWCVDKETVGSSHHSSPQGGCFTATNRANPSGWKATHKDSLMDDILLMEEIRITTWDVSIPVNNGISYLSTAAGLLPSTVSNHLNCLTKCWINTHESLNKKCYDSDFCILTWTFHFGYQFRYDRCQVHILSGWNWHLLEGPS